MVIISIFNIIWSVKIFRRQYYQSESFSLDDSVSHESLLSYASRTPGGLVRIRGARYKRERVLNVCTWIFIISCAYRSVFLTIDMNQTCWFDNPLNWIVFRHAVQTVGLLAWVFQIASVQYILAKDLRRNSYGMRVSSVVVFLMAIVGECFGWICVSTNNYLFCAIREISWTLIFVLPCVGAIIIYNEIMRRRGRVAIPTVFGVGCGGYVLFLFLCVLIRTVRIVDYSVDYLGQEKTNCTFPLIEGLKRLARCDKVRRDMMTYWQEFLWMSPTVTFCVWSSIWLSVYPTELYLWLWA